MSVLLSLALSPSYGCSLAPPGFLELDPSVEDEVPPAPPELVEIYQGRGGERPGGSSSCGDLGTITLVVARPAGDPDAEDAVGYRMEQLDGTLPDGFTLDTVNAYLGPDLSLHWVDGVEAEQEPFDFTLALIPVDVAGNEGDPVEVALEDDGIPDDLATGCSSAPGSAGAVGGLVLVLAARRRRLRRTLR